MKKQKLITIRAMVGSLVVPPSKITRYKTIERRVNNQFIKEIERNCKLKFASKKTFECPDCD
jgi:hypothetical protein